MATESYMTVVGTLANGRIFIKILLLLSISLTPASSKSQEMISGSRYYTQN